MDTQQQTQTNIERGRADLQAWEYSKPDNFFAADKNLQRVLRRWLGDAAYTAFEDDLNAFGAVCAQEIDPAAKLEDLVGNHPRLQRFSGIGERVEDIEFHPNHDLTGAPIWKSGILALQSQPENNVRQMALLYLLTHNGEGGHTCSIACTSGLIRSIQQVGDADLQATFLPSLLDPDYSTMQHGAQFLTEVQGGSDVGANAVRAEQDADGTWRITGEKWFCSNINADQFLVMARPEDAANGKIAEGTRGLGVFLVPRRLEDGSTNHFYLRRLKEKLGTRTLASAEVDFDGAVAYPIGPIDRGFKTTVELVLNTSRLFNAVSCAGVMRRAYIEAASYACTRRAFGETIASYPLVQEAVADALSETYAATASGFALAALLDKIESGSASEADEAVYRVLVNLNKYITSIRGTEIVHRAIEVLGGNGAIETFSILPRLYRDMVVLESWEGTHNVLCLQVLRDIQRYNLHEPFLRFIHAQLAAAADESLAENVKHVTRAVEHIQRTLGMMQSGGEAYAQAHARRLADLMSITAQAALMLSEAQWEIDNDFNTVKPLAITHFVNRHLRTAYDPMSDGDYLHRLERLMAAY